MLPKPIGYRYFYINEDWEYIETTRKEYEKWNKYCCSLKEHLTEQCVRYQKFDYAIEDP